MERSSSSATTQAKKPKTQPVLYGFLDRKSANDDINKKWKGVVSCIRKEAKKNVKSDESLAIQSIEEGDICNAFFRLPYKDSEVGEYLNQEMGELDHKAMEKDPEIKAWWEESTSENKDMQEDDCYMTWYELFTEHLEDITGEIGLPGKPLAALLQKHFATPFVEICVDDDKLEADSGPLSVTDGDTGMEFASLADLLEDQIGVVLDAKTRSICSAESGKLLYGMPWHTKEHVEEEDEEEDEEDDEDEDEDECF
jgi:hypothetical protein